MNATHFIEVLVREPGTRRHPVVINMDPAPIADLGWALKASSKMGMQTVAIIKIKPKAKP